MGKETIVASRNAVCIIFAGTRDFLEGLAMVRNLLYRLKLLVIVPDESDDTIKAAHQLRPRLVRAAGGDYSDIAEIALKMRNASPDGGWSSGKSKTMETNSRSV